MIRFPGFVIVIGSEKGCFIGSKQYGDVMFIGTSLQNVLEKLEETFPVVPSLIGMEEFNEDIWNEFYRSQNIKERKNLGLFLRNMPKRFHDQPGLAPESYIIKRSHKLTDFF